MSSTTLLYTPALRMKAGELQGLRALASDVADCVLPRLIVPPSAERDESVQPALFESVGLPDISVALASHWARRRVLVESTYLLDEFGRDELGRWLPQMFERARRASVEAVPLVRARDLLTSDVTAYGAAVDRSAQLQFALVISSGELNDREFLSRVLTMLASIDVAADRCLVITDFHDADLSAPEVVAPIIGAALEDLQLAAPWLQVVFQGTNFPEKNPADPGSYCLVPRTEWIAWQRAVAYDPGTADHLLFGDYAADCARMAFGASGAAAIRHYRYATPNAWLVQRGEKSGNDQEIMRNVCEAILDSGHFAGRTFSSADEYIFRAARGVAGPGNATGWRAVNTTHHITRVVRDMGAVRGRRFKEISVEPLAVQVPLFV